MERYELKYIGGSSYICIDREMGVSCSFEEHQFNETHRFIADTLPREPTVLARAAREMGDWLAENHYNTIMPINHRQRIGSMIRGFRQDACMTQADLAEAIGTQQGNVARIEAGKYSVGFDTLQDIADVFGCEVVIAMPVKPDNESNSDHYTNERST